MKSLFMARDQVLSRWNESTDSTTLDNQKLLTLGKPLEYKTHHHPTTSSTLGRTPHPNKKQDKNTNPIISRQDYHLTQPWPSEGREEKLSTNLTLYDAYTNNWTKARRAETKRKKEVNLEDWEKETSNTISFKK